MFLLQYKRFVDFASSKSPESVGVEIIEHKTSWSKDFVFLFEEISSFCSSKPTYCKVMLREMHKIRK